MPDDADPSGAKETPPPLQDDAPPPLQDDAPPPLQDDGDHSSAPSSRKLREPSRPSNEDARKTLLGKRFAAALIDGLIGCVIMIVFSIFHPALGALSVAVYILLKDGCKFEWMNGRSFGKQVLHLRPVVLSGGEMNLKLSALRNWPLALPALFSAIGSGSVFWLFSLVAFLAVVGEIFLVVTKPFGRRFGDQMADTEVRSELQ